VQKKPFAKTMTDAEAQSLFESGLELSNEKRYLEASIKYRAAADLGHLSAMNSLGELLLLSNDISNAYKWFKRAAKRFEPRALRNLALGYHLGVPLAGIGLDSVEAARLMRVAAEAGHAGAMYDLGDWLRQASPRDPAAQQWFRKGAEAGDLLCVRMIGHLYRYGECGLSRDFALALQWYQRAADTGDLESIVCLGDVLQDARFGDLERSVQVYNKAVDGGSAVAMFKLARLYEDGKRGVTKNVDLAAQLFQRASDLGNVEAMTRLAKCYASGAGVTKDVDKAVELLERASDRGNVEAMSRLAVHYANGDGVTKSVEKVVELLQRATAVGDVGAMVFLGVCHACGNGVAPSVRIAVDLWLRAAARRYPNVKQFLHSDVLKAGDDMIFGVATGMLAGGEPDAARTLVGNRGSFSLGDFVFDGDNFPLDRIGDTLRLFAEFDRSIQSLQFAIRLDKQRPPACTANDLVLFARFAKLVDGVVADDHDAILQQVSLLLLHGQFPLELYEALKRVMDARVAKLTVKSVLPLVCVLDELDRTIRSLEFVVGPARFGLRACLCGAMSEHLLAAKLPSDLSSETALETTLLWLGVVRQAEFFGRAVPERVALVEEDVEERLRNDKVARDKYATILVRDLKRRVPHLLLATPEFAAASAAKLDGEIENKRVKVILVGDSGVGKTQIRRRLGGVHAFEAEHTSTDTAEVTSVEVTSLTVASSTQWIERDDASTSEHMKLYGPAVAQSLMLLAVGADQKQSTLTPSGKKAPERASSTSSNNSDAQRNVAPTTSVSVAATSSSSNVPTVGDSEPVAVAAESSVSNESAPADMSSSLFVPQELDFSVMDERKVLSLWDFGGQVEYFVVHDLFLTRGAVYVLVVDWTKGVENARESAQRWMNAIRAHVGDDALVLPVLPRCNQQSDDDNAIDDVARELEKLVGCMPVRVDSATDRNYAELKIKLLKMSDACMARNGKVPLRWLQMHDELCRLRAEKKKQWITRNEFRALLQSLHGKNAATVTNVAVENALTFLKQSGTVLTCGGGGRVSEHVFLDPELFLRLVQPLINTEAQIAKRRAAARNDGVVAASQRALEDDFERMSRECTASHALLEHLWRGVQSPTNEISFFVELLEHCGLMCELERGAFFLPAASKATPRDGLRLEWVATSEQIALVCESVSAVPPSLMPRIVASLFKSDAIDKPNKQRIVTQSDVVLLLRVSGGADLRRIRLQQRGNAFVITLQRLDDDDDAAGRAWRVRAYVALYCAIESVLRLVFGNLTVRASVWCTDCDAWHAGDICSACDRDLASIDAWLPRKGDELFAQRKNWRVMAVTSEPTLTLDVFLAQPSVDALLKWCGEHCDGVRAGVVACFPAELRERAEFWSAIRRVTDVYRDRATFDVAVFYPGREFGGNVASENNLADAIQQRVGTSKAVYNAALDRHGRFDDSIISAAVGCRRAVFVVSRLWCERKWCLAEMLLAMADGDEAKCKVILFGDDVRTELLPLHHRIVRERFDAKKLLSEEAARLAMWVHSSMIDDNNNGGNESKRMCLIQ
jgi:TPR repeat protein/GTPase SAR1 family protein